MTINRPYWSKRLRELADQIESGAELHALEITHFMQLANEHFPTSGFLGITHIVSCCEISEDDRDRLRRAVEGWQWMQRNVEPCGGVVTFSQQLVSECLQHIAALEAELAACRDEVERWRQLARVQDQAIQAAKKQQADLAAAKAEVERLRNYLRDIQHILKSTSPLDFGPRLTCVRMIEEAITQEPTP